MKWKLLAAAGKLGLIKRLQNDPPFQVDHKLSPEELAQKYGTDLENVGIFIQIFLNF
jgi:hypothetical protein